MSYRYPERIIYRVPRDAHADILLLSLKLEDLGDRREAHFINLIKSFISGKCHPAMLSFVDVRTDKTLQLASPGPLLADDDHLCLVPPFTISI